MAGFTVDGAIDDEKIILRGVAPALGLNSCKIETTYNDTLLLTAVAAPGESQQATLPPAETSAFKDNISLCRTGDKQACRAVLASPLLTEERRAEFEAAAALPTAASTPVYLLFPFQCVIENGKPVFKPSTEPYYHEALDYRSPSSYALCSPDKGGWVQSLITTCHVIELTSFRLACKNGIAQAPGLTPAGKSTFAKNSRVDGDTVLLPLYSRWRTADVPEGFHRLPAGWGLVPPPMTLTAAKSLELFFGDKQIPVIGSAAQAMPRSFFLTLTDWAPLPEIMALAIFLTAAGFAAFGFSLDPDSPLSSRRAVFWIWLVIAAVGISSALSAGHAIKEAFDQGHREAAAIEKDRARLQALFPKRNGHVEPFQQRDLDLARDLQKPRTITNAAAVAADVPSRAFFYVLPALVFLIAYVRFMYAGYHYLVVRHPVEAVAAPALRSGGLLDKKKLVDALRGDPNEFTDHPPLHRTQNLLRRAHLLREKIETDADIAEAAMRRDRARALQAEAEADLREARKKLSWWQRLFGSWL